MDQLLQYLAAINGHSNMQLAQMNPDITPMPGTPKSTSSKDSSPSSSQTSPSYDTEEETSDDKSIASTTGDRQLRPCLPISYNDCLKSDYMDSLRSEHSTTCPYHFQVTVQKKKQTQKSVKQMKKVNSCYKH